MENHKSEANKNNSASMRDELLFKLAMLEYAQQDGADLLAENERLKNENRIAPSELDTARFKKSLTKRLAKKRKKDTPHAFGKFLLPFARPLAAGLVMLALTFSITFASSAGFRRDVMKFFANFYSEYMEMGAEGANTAGIDWSRGYYPSYIPPNYMLADKRINETSKRAVFIDKIDESKTIVFDDCFSEGIVRVDTANSKNITKTKIGDFNVVLIEKDGHVSANCVDVERSRFVSIWSSLSVAETTKVIERIKYIP